MTLTVGARFLCLLGAGALLLLTIWTVFDGPVVEEPTGPTQEPTEPSVQCASVAGGAYTDHLEDEVTFLSEDEGTGLLELGGGDRVHEEADLPDPQDPYAVTGDPDGRIQEENAVLSALQDKVDRCDRARDGRIALAGLSALPGVLLLAVAMLATVTPTPPRHHDAPSPVRRGDDA